MIVGFCKNFFFLYIITAIHCSAKFVQNANEDGGICSANYNNQNCSSVNAAQNYSLKLSDLEYYSMQIFRVKVFAKNCPRFSSPGPQWYTLEALQGRDKGNAIQRHSVGTFHRPFQRSEAQLCKNQNKLVFLACEPNSLDLPANYEWTAPEEEIGTVCFRLMVKTDNISACEVVENCISPVSLTSSGEDQDTSHFGSGSGDYSYQQDDLEGDIPVGLAEDSSNHQDLSEDYEDSDHEDGHFYPKPTCIEERQVFSWYGFDWTPACDCSGYYKLIQCLESQHDEGETECWCSTRMGSEIAHSRRKLACSDPEEFSFFCPV